MEYPFIQPKSLSCNQMSLIDKVRFTIVLSKKRIVEKTGKNQGIKKGAQVFQGPLLSSFLLDPADCAGVSSDNEKTPDSRFGNGGRMAAAVFPPDT